MALASFQATNPARNNKIPTQNPVPNLSKMSANEALDGIFCRRENKRNTRRITCVHRETDHVLCWLYFTWNTQSSRANRMSITAKTLKLRKRSDTLNAMIVLVTLCFTFRFVYSLYLLGIIISGRKTHKLSTRNGAASTLPGNKAKTGHLSTARIDIAE